MFDRVLNTLLDTLKHEILNPKRFSRSIDSESIISETLRAQSNIHDGAFLRKQ